MWITVAVLVTHPDKQAVKDALEPHAHQFDEAGNWWFMHRPPNKEGKDKHDYLKLPFDDPTRCSMCRGCVEMKDVQSAWAIVTPDGAWFDPDVAKALGILRDGEEWKESFLRIASAYPNHVIVYVGGHR